MEYIIFILGVSRYFGAKNCTNTYVSRYKLSVSQEEYKYENLKKFYQLFQELCFLRVTVLMKCSTHPAQKTEYQKQSI